MRLVAARREEVGAGTVEIVQQHCWRDRHYSCRLLLAPLAGMALLMARRHRFVLEPQLLQLEHEKKNGTI